MISAAFSSVAFSAENVPGRMLVYFVDTPEVKQRSLLCSYNITMKTKRMGRPPKSKAERKDVDLRIPVTNDQKELIARAAKMTGEDMAAWARPILLRAASDAVSQQQR